MSGEATIPQGEATVPEVEPRNVREAIALRQSQGDPGFQEVTEQEAHAYPDGTPNPQDEFSDIVPPGPAAPPAEDAPPATDDTGGAVDPYAEFGGREYVQDAVSISGALRTENGVRTIVAQGLQALGYDPAQVRAFLDAKEAAAPTAAAPAAAPVGLPDIEDDDVVTGSDMKRLLQWQSEQLAGQFKTAQEEATKPLALQLQEERQRQATHIVDSTLSELLGIKDGTPTEDQKRDIGFIQQAAGQYIDSSSWDPSHIRNAIIRGHADVQAETERRVQAYITAKRAQAQGAPANIGGASPAGGEEQAEPKNMKEAIAMRKALGVF